MAGRLESIAIGACRRFNAANGALSARAIPASRSKTSRHSVAAINPCLPTASMTDRYHSAIFSRIQQRSFHATSTTSDNPTEKTVTSEDKAPAIASEPACSPKVEELFQKIIWLDMIELHLLAELINEKLGLKISDAEKERMARGGGGKKAADDGDDAPAEVKEEKTAFDLKLTGFDAKAKIKVIKEIRGITSLGLKEAKELVEGAPTTVKKQIKMEEAEELKKKLEEVGATVEIV